MEVSHRRPIQHTYKLFQLLACNMKNSDQTSKISFGEYLGFQLKNIRFILQHFSPVFSEVSVSFSSTVGDILRCPISISSQTHTNLISQGSLYELNIKTSLVCINLETSMENFP